MASISSISSHDTAYIEPSTTLTPSVSTPALPPAHSPAEGTPVTQISSRRSFHPDFAADSAEQVAPKFLHGFQLRSKTMENVYPLFNGADDMSLIGRGQDQERANEMCRLSQMPLPASMKANDGVLLPPDLMAYWVRHDNEAMLLYTCPEINGIGFGGIATMPPGQFRHMMNTHSEVAREIMRDALKQGEQPLLLVANSGREGAQRSDGRYATKDGSKMIWEKAHVAEQYARHWGSKSEECFADSLDKLTTSYYQAIDSAAERFGKDSPQYRAAEQEAHARATATMAEFKDKPLVLLGYSRDVATCCRVENGRAYLFGRPVNGLLNDRAAENLNMVQMTKLDFTKMALINSTVEEGVNKFAAALARAEFANSPQAARLPEIAADRGFHYDVQGLDKAFHYTDQADKGDVEGLSPLQLKAHYSTFFRGVEAHEGLDGVAKAYDDFLALGHDIRPLFKPNGTGQAKGIIGVRHGESKEEFLQRFQKNQEYLKTMFGDGAGYPFQVEPLVELARTVEGENYDLRFTILHTRQPQVDENGRLSRSPARTMHAFPLLWKKEPAPDGARTGPIEFAPTNITAAVAKTGRPANDFVQPLCTKKGIEESGMSENLVKSQSLYFSAFYSYLLETRYARSEQAHVQVEGSRVLPFRPTHSSGVSIETAQATRPDASQQSAQQLLERFG